MAQRERLGSFDSLIWWLDRVPGMRADFSSVSVLDGKPDIWRIRNRAAQLASRFPRLSQRIDGAPLGAMSPALAGPRWVDTGSLRPDAAVRSLQVDGTVTRANVLQLTTMLAQTPLDMSGHPWEMTVMAGSGQGPAALVQRVHHCLADGMGWLQIAMAFTDRDPGGSASGPADGAEVPLVAADGAVRPGAVLPAPLRGSRAASGKALESILSPVVAPASRIAGVALAAVRDPRRTVQSFAAVVEVARELGSQLSLARHPGSRMMRPRSGSSGFAVLSMPSGALLHAARHFGVSRGELSAVAVARAIGYYHRALGESCGELRMGYPLIVSSGGEGSGNHFFPARVLVPAGGSVMDQASGLHGRLEIARRAAAAGVLSQVSFALTLLPAPVLDAAVRWQLGALDFTSTVLAGARSVRYLAGSKVMSSYPFGPLLGAAVNTTGVIWEGRLDIGIHVDTAAVRSLPLMVECMRFSFEELTGELGDRRLFERSRSRSRSRRPAERSNKGPGASTLDRKAAVSAGTRDGDLGVAGERDGG